MNMVALIRFALLAATASAVAVPQQDLQSSIPACDSVYGPCRCPAGTTFKNMTSFGIIGAPVDLVANNMLPFLNIEYQGGLMPNWTTGREGQPGATRTFNFAGPSGGRYNITEELTRAFRDNAGNFQQNYRQAPKPATVKVPGGGTYNGGWTSINGQQTLIANETAVAWKNVRCETGVTFPSAMSHEGAITNASAIITKNGKHTGIDIRSFTILYEQRQD